jgi:beta-glucosidase/6-phospho-beta-glucosidase/beta-galactosidase
VPNDTPPQPGPSPQSSPGPSPQPGPQPGPQPNPQTNPPAPSAHRPRPAHPGIFPTFFLSGFECSTFIWKDQGRRDLAAETQHREHLDEDYALLRSLGIAVAREGIPWPFIDCDGACDFSALDPFIEAMAKHQVLPIWDLCHYGYPDGLDPFDPAFAERFAAYARAAAEYVVPRLRGPHFFTPINEITFFAFMGGEWAWTAPFETSDAKRRALRLALCRADIAAAKAIRAVDPEARMVHIDPLIVVVPPKDRPDLAGAAEKEMFEDTFYAWDVIAGLRHKELGGSPEILDIVGVNCYSFGQMEYRETGPHASLEPNDERIRPLGELLQYAYERYRRPMIVGETSGLGSGRPEWLCDMVEESLAAVHKGIDLHGICLFPAVDMPDWHKGGWLNNGLCDLEDDNGRLKRIPFAPYIDELRRWQKRLNRVTELDEDPFSDPVDLDDIKQAADRMRLKTDKDWS